MKIRYYLITGLLALGFFLLANMPAAPVVNAFKEQMPGVKIQNVSGTLWQGSAQQITVQSRHVLKNVNWSVCISHLLLAKACVELDARYNNKPLSGQFSVGLSNKLQGKNIVTTLSAQTLGQMVTLPMGEIAGDIALDLASLEYEQGGVPAIDGIIKWSNASITIAETAKLGDITIKLAESDEHPINAEISNQNGQLVIAGQASVSATTDYAVDLTLTPDNTASNNLKNSLSLFAKRQPNGSFAVKNSGNLKNLGLM